MRQKQEQPYIDFYKRHDISPVTQDITDLDRHFSRRANLYRRLGIVPSFVRGRSVIEFGPGSGHNALYTYGLGPSRYLLVDGNPKGLKECEALLGQHYPLNKRFETHESLIEDYASDELFDLVICEGLIPAQKDPKGFAAGIARFTRPGGVCIITCHDPVGMLTDLLRCLIGQIVTKEDMSLERKTDVLVATFKNHLNCLKGMSRPHADWVVDQIIHKALWRDSSMFSVVEAVDTLGNDFDIYGTSPCFIKDWRWYKDVHGDQSRFNEIGRKNYMMNVHNFLDYRFETGPRLIGDNERLIGQCDAVWKAIKAFGHERETKHIEAACRGLAELAGTVGEFSPDTAQAIRDALKALEQYPKIGPDTDWGRFAQWWGRASVYVSFIRSEIL